MNMEFKRKLAIPMEGKEMYPLTGNMGRIKEERDAEIQKIFSGRSDKLLLIIGPCSADNEDSVMDYLERLARVQEQVEEKILIVPRVYTNKPRTTGDGYKGLLHQPNPEEKPDMFKGIIATRKLHMRVIRDIGLTSADEMLYPENWGYVSGVEVNGTETASYQRCDPIVFGTGDEYTDVEGIVTLPIGEGPIL